MQIMFKLLREKKGGFRIEGGLKEGDVWLKNLIAKHKGAPRPKLEIGPDDTALFQYSGGTTGVSKGAVALHRNVVANTMQMKAWFVTSQEGKEVYLMAIPLFHVYGMVAGMAVALANAATMGMVAKPPGFKDIFGQIFKNKST